MTRERLETFKDYLRKWDFQIMPLMPIAEEEAEYLIKLFDQMDREREKKHEWYVENRQSHNERMKEYYHESKAKAFIRGTKHD